MTQRIKRLPEHVANQIAAGEVIQRPASVVKELMENAVDAGATSIEVHVLDAGRTSIQVIDDGCGMSPADAKACFERHATSKLSSAEDLLALATKGFRGEALASIAAIAHVELTTKMAGDEVATVVRCRGDEPMQEGVKAAPVGTSFHVKNLFFNVPARRNFLKSDAVELRHVVDEFQRVAFAHPSIEFALTHQGSPLFRLKPGTSRQRIVGILGAKHDERLVPVQESTDVVTVDGFVGKPDSARKTRGEQFLMVNGRFVKHGLLHRAIVRAYDGLLPEGQHPLYVLHLTVDPAKVDVNIHPTKIEVKFEEEQPIIAILKSAVKRGLGAHNVAPSIDFEADTGLNLTHVKPGQVVSEPQIQFNPDYNPFKQTSTAPAARRSSSALTPAAGGWKDLYEVMEQTREEAVRSEPETLETSVAEGLEVLLWKGEYLVFPTSEGLTLLHIRRAHMRVLYETYLGQMQQLPDVEGSQRLLIPEEVALTQAEVLALDDASAELLRMGLEVKRLNDESVAIHAVPAGLDGAGRDAIDAVLEAFHEGAWEDVGTRRERWAKAWCMQAARKAGSTMSMAERRRLIQTLWSCEHPNNDPWGKPTLVHLKSDQTEQPFG